MTETVAIQIVVDAHGAEQGFASFEAAAAKAKAAANDVSGVIGNSFETAQRKWNASIAAADPIYKAQLNMQKAIEAQTIIGNRAVQLGIATQAQAAVQIEAMSSKYQRYIDKAVDAEAATTTLGKAQAFLSTQLGGLLGLFAVGAIVEFGKSVFEDTAKLGEQAKVLAVSTDQLQAYRNAGREAGLATDQLDVILRKYTASVGAAREGGAAQIKALSDLHLSVNDLAGDTGSSLPKFIRALQAQDDAQKSAHDSIAFLGRGGQELIPLFDKLSMSSEELVQHYKDMGLITDEALIKKMHEAEITIGTAWAQIKVATSPIIGWLGDATAFLASGVSFLVTKFEGLLDVVGRIKNTLGNFVLGPGFEQHGAAGSWTPDTASTDPLAAVKAAMEYKAQLTGLSKVTQDYQANVIELAKAIGIEGNNFKDVDDALGKHKADIEATAMANAKLTVANEAAAESQKKLVGKSGDFDKYLAGLNQAAASAGLVTAQLQDQQAVIKGAQELQKSQGETQDHLIQGYSQALDFLKKESVARGVDLTAQINSGSEQVRLNGLLKDGAVNQAILSAAMGADADHRALAVKNMQDEIAAGGVINANGQLEIQLTDQARAAIVAKNAAAQAGADAPAMKDYLDRLRQEVSLERFPADLNLFEHRGIP